MEMFSNKRNRRLGLCALVTVGMSSGALAQTSPNIDTVDFVLNNFDYFNNKTSLDGYWFTFTDQGSQTEIDTIYGNSVLTAFGAVDQYQYDTLGNYNRVIFPQGHGGDSTNFGFRFGYILGDRLLTCGDACTYPGYVGFGAGLKANDTLDLSAAAGLAFWAKADSATVTFNVSVSTRDTTTGLQAYAQSFTIDTSWTLCQIKLVASDTFKQPDWAPQTPFEASRATSFGFGFNAGDNALHMTNALTIDDLVIQKWKYIEPEIPIEIPIEPDAILAKTKNHKNRFGMLWTGNGYRIQLPSNYFGQSGRIQALNTQGKVVAETAFSAHSTEVEMPWASRSAASGPLHFRVLSAKTLP